MRKEYDFAKAKRGSVIAPVKGNSRINDALREHIKRKHEPLETILRRILREELRSAGYSP